jgi:heme-degrading monooxygenase HmoA
MVVRVFRARIRPGKEDEFERFVMGKGVPLVTAQAGCSHVTVGKSRWSDQPEFIVLTHWDSIDALESFAGEDWRQAVVEPEEEHMLTEVLCDHYEAMRPADPRAADQVCEDRRCCFAMSCSEGSVGNSHALLLPERDRRLMTRRVSCPLGASSGLLVDVVDPVDLFGIGLDDGDVQVDDDCLLTAPHDHAR